MDVRKIEFGHRVPAGAERQRTDAANGTGT